MRNVPISIIQVKIANAKKGLVHVSQNIPTKSSLSVSLVRPEDLIIQVVIVILIVITTTLIILIAITIILIILIVLLLRITITKVFKSESPGCSSRSEREQHEL